MGIVLIILAVVIVVILVISIEGSRDDGVQ